MDNQTGRREVTLGRSSVIGLNLVVKLSAKRMACKGTRANSSGSSETLAAPFFGAPILNSPPFPLFLHQQMTDNSGKLKQCRRKSDGFEGNDKKTHLYKSYGAEHTSSGSTACLIRLAGSNSQSIGLSLDRIFFFFPINLVCVENPQIGPCKVLADRIYWARGPRCNVGKVMLDSDYTWKL